MDANYPPPVYEDIVTEDKEIPTVENGTIPIRIYKSPKTKGKKAPVCVLYSLFTSSQVDLISYHGGGFVLGDIDREDRTISICRSR
jgi:acetyl esterase/lipase